MDEVALLVEEVDVKDISTSIRRDEIEQKLPPRFSSPSTFDIFKGDGPLSDYFFKVRRLHSYLNRKRATSTLRYS